MCVAVGWDTGGLADEAGAHPPLPVPPPPLRSEFEVSRAALGWRAACIRSLVPSPSLPAAATPASPCDGPALPGPRRLTWHRKQQQASREPDRPGEGGTARGRHAGTFTSARFAPTVSVCTPCRSGSGSKASGHDRRVLGSIPVRGTDLHCRFDPGQVGARPGRLSLFPSLPRSPNISGKTASGED